jgi:hypothetical protein
MAATRARSTSRETLARTTPEQREKAAKRKVGAKRNAWPARWLPRKPRRRGSSRTKQGGTNALQMQQALSGALGPEAQAQAYAALQSSPMFAQMLQQGETSLLQNASATGGLRGGNTQAALATLGPQLLQQLAMQQFGQLGSLSGMGLQAAGQSGQFGLTGAGLQGATLGNLGAIEAGGILGQQAARSGFRREAGQLAMQGAGAGLSLATGLPMGGGGVPPPTGQGGGF